MTITLTSFIRYECANYITSGESVGICIGIDVHGKRFMNEAKCLVMTKKRCDYFKACVLPLSKLKGCYDRVFREYRKFDKSVDQSEEAKFCECGKEIPKNKQICDKCRKSKRKETHREYNEKRQSRTTTEVQFFPVINACISMSQEWQKQGSVGRDLNADYG